MQVKLVRESGTDVAVLLASPVGPYELSWDTADIPFQSLVGIMLVQSQVRSLNE
jgi:hypothetical protein